MNESSRPDKALTASAMMTVAAKDVRRDRQAYEILRWGFTALPIIAGADKFFLALVDWHKYLSPPFAVFGVNTTMQIVGAVEILVGLGMAFLPRFFAPIVMVWLWGIIANLLVLGNYYDIALRDFGLSLGALALWRLGQHFGAHHAQT